MAQLKKRGITTDTQEFSNFGFFKLVSHHLIKT